MVCVGSFREDFSAYTIRGTRHGVSRHCRAWDRTELLPHTGVARSEPRPTSSRAHEGTEATAYSDLSVLEHSMVREAAKGLHDFLLLGGHVRLEFCYERFAALDSVVKLFNGLICLHQGLFILIA